MLGRGRYARPVDPESRKFFEEQVRSLREALHSNQKILSSLAARIARQEAWLKVAMSYLVQEVARREGRSIAEVEQRVTRMVNQYMQQNIREIGDLMDTQDRAE